MYRDKKLTHHDDIFGPILNGSEEAENNDDDVQEICKDGGPLVTQEIKDLSLQC